MTSPMTSRPRALLAALLFALLAAGCEREVIYEEAPPDFFVTVQLTQDIRPAAVDRLEVVISDNSMRLAPSTGDIFEGEISWETRDGAAGDELAIEVTGEFFDRNIIEMPGRLYELDIPVLGGLEGPSATFRLAASAYWEDDRGDEQRVGFGTNTAAFPLEQSSITIELDCADAAWNWTCRTGCTEGSASCAADASVCDDDQSCRDGCCFPPR